MIDRVTDRIRSETDPIWKRYFIAEKKHLSDPTNWHYEDGMWKTMFDAWGVLCALTKSEDRAIKLLEHYGLD